jgi:murein DD-endopeptidase MepM/ murein hydrolase activator NlpD
MKLMLLRPVPKQFPISSKFGLRVINGKEQFHKGIDFACPVGTPIQASAEGTIYRASWENPSDPNQGFGLRVIQRVEIEDKVYFFYYAHQSQLRCEPEQRVKTGKIIGLSGATGRTWSSVRKGPAPHLHFGCRISDTAEWIDVDFFTAGENEAA